MFKYSWTELLALSGPFWVEQIFAVRTINTVRHWETRSTLYPVSIPQNHMHVLSTFTLIYYKEQGQCLLVAFECRKVIV